MKEREAEVKEALERGNNTRKKDERNKRERKGKSSRKRKRRKEMSKGGGGVGEEARKHTKKEKGNRERQEKRKGKDKTRNTKREKRGREPPTGSLAHLTFVNETQVTRGQVTGEWEGREHLSEGLMGRYVCGGRRVRVR